MKYSSKKWEILSNVKSQISNVKTNDIVEALFVNRGIKTKKEKQKFLNPIQPEKITLKSLEIKSAGVNKAIKRINQAKKKKEKIIIYGDYDADGICATAILWETLYALGLDVLPYIPERFSEGYGLNVKGIQNVKSQMSNAKLIITVDNGIVANEAVKFAKKQGVDVIVTDHHLPGEKLPKAHSIIHTTRISGAGIAWIFGREIARTLKNKRTKEQKNSLDLAAIGTVADQIPLLGPNRSFVKYGLEELSNTRRFGLLELFKEAGLGKYSRQVGSYEIGFIIAPRINAMGRLSHGIDSLRLLCTKDAGRAKELAFLLGKTNKERQKIVEEVVLHSRTIVEKREWKGVIVISHESYHEGVIGLVAAELVKKYYRPAIVISKGKEKSKASARSISGFNIIEAIRDLEDMLLGAGGHPMAAGFSIESEKIEEFTNKLEKASSELLTNEILSKKLKIDLEIDFSLLNWDLLKVISSFEPTGIGNPTPTFATKKVNVMDVRAVGFEGKHLKLKLEKEGKVFDAIAFGFGEMFAKLSSGNPIDIAFNFEENVWNGRKSMQLKVRDIKTGSTSRSSRIGSTE